MIEKFKEKIKKSFSFIKIPGLNGFSLLDLIELYFLGLTRGTLTSRAGSISFSFFMALFPFILFVLKTNSFHSKIFQHKFCAILFNFIENILPQDTHTFFEKIFEDIKSKPRAGLKSSVFYTFSYFNCKWSKFNFLLVSRFHTMLKNLEIYSNSIYIL